MDLNYKGNYSAYGVYSAGDVVKFTDGVWYIRGPKDSGSINFPCTDTLRWERADEVTATAAEMAKEAVAKYDSDQTVRIDGVFTAFSQTGQAGETFLASNGTKTHTESSIKNAKSIIAVNITATGHLSSATDLTVSNVSCSDSGVTITIKNTGASAITYDGGVGSTVRASVSFEIIYVK